MLAAARPGGSAGGDQLDDERRPAADRGRPGAQEISDYVPDRPRQPGLEETRAPSRDAAPPPPLPEPDRGGQYRLFQRSWSGPGR